MYFLPFYFFRNPSLAIPVCALTKQQVEVHIKFKKLKDVTVSYTRTDGALSDPPSVVSSSIKEVSLVTDFFFITDDEKEFSTYTSYRICYNSSTNVPI